MDTETATTNVCIAGTWESLKIDSVSGDGEWNSPHWVVSMYASEQKATTITFANPSPADITITLTASPAFYDDGNLAFGFDKSTLVVPGKGKASVVFWVRTEQSVAPGSYFTTVTIER